MGFARESNERMAWLVPKQNIETWLRALSGEPPDEDTDYKRRGHEPVSCDVVADVFVRSSPEQHTALPLLRSARVEIERVRP